MAKLTKKQRIDLERALRQAELASSYILNENTIICRPDFNGKPYRENHFYNEERNLCISSVEKSYGNTLCQLQDAIITIKSFLENN